MTQEITAIEREFIEAYVNQKLERATRGITAASTRYRRAKTQLFAQRFGYGDVAKLLNERELEVIVNNRILEEQAKRDLT